MSPQELGILENFKILRQSRMNSYAGRITRSYADLSGCIRNLSLMCDKLIIYQHDADEEIKSTHIHMLATFNYDVKTIKNAFKAHKLKGNEDWSFKRWDKKMKAVTYMTKGILEPSYYQNVTKAYLDEAKAEWINYEEKLDEFRFFYREFFTKPLADKECYEYINFWSKLDAIPQTEIKIIAQQGSNVTITDESTYPRFNAIKKHVFRELFQHRPKLDKQFFNIRKALVLTFCYTENIKMPPARDAWDSLE